MKSFSLRSFLWGVGSAVGIAALLFLLYFYLPIGVRTNRPDSFAAMKKISEVEGLIRRHYIEEIDESLQTDQMLQALVDGLDDRYADYYTAEEFEEVKRSNAGMMKGIGISISQELEDGTLRIVYVQPDSPAEDAGLLEGDILLAVNGENLEGKSSTETAEYIQLQPDQMTLRIRRGEEEMEVALEKAEIRTTAVTGTMLEDEIGYLAIHTFHGLTAEQFAEVYTELQEDGMRALILDLRNNLGGLVSACCDTASQILPKGVIVYEQDRTGEERHQDSTGETPVDIPMVLLVNRYTASASEIFTGAVRDYELATIVGEQTFGKGIEQNTYTLSDGSALKITTTVYYTPNHEDINGTGISPDIAVELPEDAETDLQLEKAVEILKNK